MSAHAIGIDFGTSGARAAALDEAGAVLAIGAARHDAFGPDPTDPASWLASMAAALERLAAEVAIGEARAIAVDATSGTVLAVSAGGALIGRPLMYDSVVDDAAILAALAAHAPRDSAARGASSGLARALMLQRRPGVARILHQADWIAAAFSGRFDVSDESNALKTGYDPVSRRWPDWIAETGLATGLLPQVVPVGAVTGRVTEAAARRYGLREGAAVVAGPTDGCASFLASGADRPGDGVTVLGTTLTLKLLSDRPVFAPEYGIYSHRIGEMWLAGGASNTGGGVLEAHFAPEAVEALSARIDRARPSGLDYYPLRAPGERFPVSDPGLAPRLGPRPEDNARFLQGMFEGMARIEALGYRRLAELGAPALSRLFTAGGAARNPAWREIRRRTLGVPLVEPLSDAAAVGTARVALGALA